jgi:hypothetical protein
MDLISGCFFSLTEVCCVDGFSSHLNSDFGNRADALNNNGVLLLSIGTEFCLCHMYVGKGLQKALCSVKLVLGLRPSLQQASTLIL